MLHRKIYQKKDSILFQASPFVVSEYLDRIENTCIKMWEDQTPVDKTITLWWGLDGLKLEQDGTTKWVSRKKKPVVPKCNPVNSGIFHSLVPCYVPSYRVIGNDNQMSCSYNKLFEDELRRCCAQITQNNMILGCLNRKEET